MRSTALVPALAAAVLAWADERRAEGRLLFHDLLVLARDALRDTTTCVPRAARRYRARADRRVPGHRPAADRDRGAARVVAIPTSRRRAWYDDPLCPTTRAGCSSSATRSSRSTGSAGPTSSSTGTRKTVFADTALHLTENFRTVASIVEFVNGALSAWMRPDAAGPSPTTCTLDAARSRSRRRPRRSCPIGDELDDAACSRDQRARGRRGRAGDRAGEARGLDGRATRDRRAFAPARYPTSRC